MGTKHTIHIEGDFKHFAPSKESIRVRLAPFPKKKKVDKLSFIVKDRDDKVVYKVDWPWDKGPLLPPRDFSWDGRINQGGDGFVTPLKAPYEITVELDLSEEVPLSQQPSDLSPSNSEPSSCPFEKPASVLELVAVAGSARSTSYRHAQGNIDQLVVAGGKVGRFFYATGAATTDEPALTLEVKLKNHDVIERLRFELVDGQERRVWSKTIDDGFEATMKIPGDELLPYLVAKDAPYKLKVSIDAPLVVLKENVAWTYIDVAVEKVELFWGLASTLGPRTEANVLLEEALILRKLKKISPDVPDPRSESKALSDDTSAGDKAVSDKDAYEVELSSNIFYQNTSEWTDTTGFDQYRQVWGDGPRIPIVAKVYARSSSGKAVVAPTALKGAQLLWDWEDPKLDKKEGVETSDWLEWAMERYDHTGGDHNPPSTNCHAAFGGKRGEGAAPVFPPQAKGGTFPYVVTRVGNARPWAALSEIDDQCKTGVVFQPSRMGGDTWRVRAYVYTGDPDEYASSEADLPQAAKNAGLPTAATGTFEIWRRVDVLLYLKKAQSLPDVDVAAVNKQLAPARVRVAMPKANKAAVDAIFDTHLKNLFKNPAGQSVLNAMAPLDEQKDSAYALKLKSWDAIASQAVLDGLDDYIKSLTKTADQDRVKLAKRRIEAAQRGRWRILSVYLGPDDCRALDSFVQARFPVNANSVKCSAVSVVANLASLMMHLGSPAIRVSLNPNVLLPVVKAYVDATATLNGDKSPLGGQAGLYVLHAAAVFSGQHDMSGGAVSVGAGANLRGRSMFFFAYPSAPDDVLKIDPTHGDFRAFSLPATVSDTFKNEAVDDYQALLFGSANVSIVKALDAVITAAAWADPASALKGKGSNLKVQSRNAGLVDDAKRLLEQCLKRPKLTGVTRDGKESSVFFSLSNNLDKSNAWRLSFGLWKDTLSATMRERIVRALREIYDRACYPVGEIYVHYKQDSATARRRKDAVVAYIQGVLDAVLKVITVNANKGDADVPAAYDVNSLFTHELGHTMFLPHADPEDNNHNWRHAPKYSCLMNYDPSHKEFCGQCMLALRGWNIGSSSAPKLDGGPDWGSKSAPPKLIAPSLHHHDDPVTRVPDYVPPWLSRVMHGWEHAGYHGTAYAHHDSLAAGLKPVVSEWDPASGGELGQGFYLTTDFGTACLYGIEAAQLRGGDVEVWEVEWRSDESEWGEGSAVPNDKQWGKMEKALCDNYDYLWNAAEVPPVQYKINNHALDKVRVANPRRMTLSEASDEADKALSKPVERQIPKVKVPGDGDCFFHSVAFWVKASAIERQGYFDDPNKTYGTTQTELQNTAAVRLEIANWLAKQIYNVNRADQIVAQPLTEIGQKYLSTWNLLTNNGADTSHFGASMADTVRDMPDNNATRQQTGKEAIWGDAGFLWRAVNALYNVRLYVHHGGRQPQVFGDAGAAAHIIHSGAHYDALNPNG